jgi:HK97 gp10 family phage protein
MPKLNYESRIEQTKQKIKEKPQAALREIGKFLAKEIRNDAAKSNKTRIYTVNGKQITVKPGRLKRSIGYWYRKKEGDVQVGSKAFYAKWLEFGSSRNVKDPFLMPTVLKNVSVIQSMITDALKELEKE